MALTFQTEVSDGVRTTYPVSFDFLSQAYVYVYVGDHAGYQVQVSYIWSSSTTIELTNVTELPAGTEFFIRRVVPRDNLVYTFADKSIRGALVDAENTHILHLVQEFIDGFVSLSELQSFFTDLDMQGKLIKNLGDAEEPTDAVNKRVLEQIIRETLAVPLPNEHSFIKGNIYEVPEFSGNSFVVPALLDTVNVFVDGRLLDPSDFEVGEDFMTITMKLEVTTENSVIVAYPLIGDTPAANAQREFATLQDALQGAVFLGQTVYVQERHAGYQGGGTWKVAGINDVTVTGTVDYGAVVAHDLLPLALVLQTNGKADARQFGAVPDNGVTDNRRALQSVFTHSQLTGDTVSITPTGTGIYYGISSFAPSVIARKFCLYIDNIEDMTIKGYRNRSSNIKYTGDDTGDALLYVYLPENQQWGWSVDGLGLDAAFKLDHCVLASDGRQFANSKFTGGCYERTVLDGLKLACYMTSMRRVYTNETRRYGIHACGQMGNDTSGETTSFSLDNCWVRFPGIAGYKVSNDFWYSEWNSCGMDGKGETGSETRPKFAYEFLKCRGVTLTSCGAENADAYLKAVRHFGLRIAMPIGIGLGATTGQTLATIELGGDGTVIIDAPFSFDEFTGNQYCVWVDQINNRTRVDINGGGIDKDRVFINDTSKGGWYDCVYYNGQTGYNDDRGFAPIGDGRVSKKDYVLNPVSAETGRRSLKRLSVLVENSNTAGPVAIPIAEITQGKDGTMTVTVQATVTTIAGGPSPDPVASNVLLGSSVYRANVGYDTEMGKMNVGSTISGDLSWNGDVLIFTTNAQYASALFDVTLHASSSQVYGKILI